MFGAVFAGLYDAVMRGSDRGRMARWRQRVVAPAAGRVLEVGAGTGLNFRHYRRGTTVIATDPDQAMLRRARERAGDTEARVVLLAADAERLPFRSRAFDDAVIGLALCTIPRPGIALAELRRVLRPGGLLRALEHVRMDQPVAGRLQDWLTPLWRRIAGGCHLNRRTTESVAAAGFVLESVLPHTRGLFLELTARAPDSGAKDG